MAQTTAKPSFWPVSLIAALKSMSRTYNILVSNKKMKEKKNTYVGPKRRILRHLDPFSSLLPTLTLPVLLKSK